MFQSESNSIYRRGRLGLCVIPDYAEIWLSDFFFVCFGPRLLAFFRFMHFAWIGFVRLRDDCGLFIKLFFGLLVPFDLFRCFRTFPLQFNFCCCGR